MDFFLFGIMPYIALSVLIIGSIARYDRAPYTWKASSSQFLRRKQLVWGSVLFHVGIIIVFFGHLVGLLTPAWVFDLIGISYGVKQFMAIVVGGIAGAMAIVGGAMLIHRRLFDPKIRQQSSFADTGIIMLIFAQLVIGMGTIIVSFQHLDGGEMVKFMNWSQGVFTFRTDAYLEVVGVHWIYKLHIFVGFIIFILFPFTRLVHMFSVPVKYFFRPGYQVVRSKKIDARKAAPGHKVHPAE